MPADLFDPSNEVKPQWMKWGKIGDRIRATLLGVRDMDSQLPGKEGTKVKVYECRVHDGQYHVLDENKQIVEMPNVFRPGEIVLIGGKPGIDNGMRYVKPGQIFGMSYSGNKPSKTNGFSPTKTIKVFAGEMDPEYMGERAGDVAQG